MPLASQQVEELLKTIELADEVVIAGINSPNQTVVSGPDGAIEQLIAELNDIAYKRLNTARAFHSPMMVAMLEPFRHKLQTISLNAPKLYCVSNLTGQQLTASQATSIDYWCDHLLHTVQFSQGITTLLQWAESNQNRMVLVEVGPGRTLSAFAQQIKGVRVNKFEVITGLQRDNPYLLATLGQLWLQGIEVDWLPLYGASQQQVRRIPLPTYSFERTRHWVDSTPNVTALSPNDISVKTDTPSDIEQLMLQTFQQLLGFDDISLTDDFYRLGGTSLLAVQLLAQLQEIGIQLDMASIINGDDIKTLAAKASSAIEQNEDNICIPLRTSSVQNQNVFFIHPVGGSVLLYKPIVDQLNTDYNYYGIQNINIYNRQLIRANSLRQLASRYLEEVLTIQPDGEYCLAGSSLGGSVAYEMGCQLVKAGKRVKFVAMFDSWAYYSEMFKDRTRFEQELNSLQQRYVGELAQVDSEVSDRLIEARWGLMRLLTDYKPTPSNLKIHLYKAKKVNQLHASNEPCADNGWQQYTESNITVYQIEGDHSSIHMDEGLEQICTLFNRNISDW